VGKVFESINETIAEFIQAQQMFFVGTAPLSGDGHVNLSPKGLDSFRILDDLTVAYLDVAGSGVETVAHVLENGRIVLMFCAFSGAPKIVRLHGVGEVVAPGHADFGELSQLFDEVPGLRSIIRVRCTRVSDSCGWGVPLYDYAGQRTQLIDAWEQRGEERVQQSIRERNNVSIDGLPAFDGSL